MSDSKKYLTVLCATYFMMMLLNRLNAQLSKFDTSYINTYYLQKMSIYDVVPDTKNEIIFLGNSITDIGHWEEFFGTLRVKNRGISSDITHGVLNRLHQITRVKPAKVFIMIGINDIARNIPDSIIISNYRKIVQRIQSESPFTKIYIQSILPTNNDFSDYKNHQNKTEHIMFVNKYLQSLTLQNKAVFINLYPAFVDENGKLDKRFTNDGLHLTAAGFLQWKKVLEAGRFCCEPK